VAALTPLVTERPPLRGVHPVEWLCELAGTALLLPGGLSAVCLDFGPHSPLAALPGSPRLLITVLLFAAPAACWRSARWAGAAARTSTPSSLSRSSPALRVLDVIAWMEGKKAGVRPVPEPEEELL